MGLKNEYTTILDTLNDIATDISEFDLGDYLKKFQDTPHFERFDEKFKDFKHYLIEMTADCRSAVESPIYVGVVGHYSSGKSSLLNAMLFPQKSKNLLPTGQRPVTAKCTLLRFAEPKSGHRYFQITVNDKVNSLDEIAYQRMVSGGVPTALEDTHHFLLELSAEDLAGGVFKEMESKRIELLDTPGLGGPYWNDQYALMEWIKEFKLLLVCVGVHQITEVQAQNVNPFLKHSMSPIIPVVTFWDEWKKADILQGISDEKKAQIKVKEELKRHFSSMDDALDRVIFVSAKNYIDDIELSDSVQDIFTQDWNIDNVRKALSSFVTDNKKILESQREKDSPFDKGRKESVLSHGRELVSKFNGLERDLTETMDDLRPKDEYEETLYEAIEKIRDYIDREFDRIVDRIEQVVSDGISTISVSDKYNVAFSRIKQDIDSSMQDQLSGDLKNRLKRQCERSLQRPLFSEIEATPLGDKKIRRLKEDIKEQTDDFLEHLTQPPQDDIFIQPTGLPDMAKNIVSGIIAGFRDLFITNAPLALVIIAVILLWGPINYLLSRISWFEGKTLFIFIIGGIIIIISVLGIFWSRFKAAKEKTTMQVKEKARKENRPADIRNRINEHKSKEVDDYYKNLKETVQDTLRPTMDNSDSMFIDLTDLLQKLRENIRSLGKECNAIERSIK